MIRRRVKVRRKLFGLGEIWVWEVSFAGIRWGSFLTWEEAMKSANEKALMLGKPNLGRQRRSDYELRNRVSESLFNRGC